MVAEMAANLPVQIPMDMEALRLRILRKMTVAQMPEAIVSALLNLEAVIRWADPATSSSSCFKDSHRAYLAGAFALLATYTIAVGFADFVICVWIQTDFVQENYRVVTFFYFMDVCSWWPLILLTLLGSSPHVHRIVVTLLVCVACTSFLVFMGFQRAGGGAKQRCCSRFRDAIGQALLSIFMAPFLVGVNFLFFDRSLTFRPLNRWYYIVRFVAIAWIVLCEGSYREPTTGPSIICIVAIFNSLVLAVLIWAVVPLLRRARERATKRDFLERTKVEVQGTESAAALPALPAPEGEIENAEESDKTLRRPSSRTSPNFGRLRSRKFGIEDALNTLGDTFEALLLASSAESPRVRSAILGVAIKPLAEATPERLGPLLPLILPQLLLALRWRTVKEDEDERCPLTKMLLEKTLELKDTNLASQVYWQLLALSTDNKDEAASAASTYRAVRIKLLSCLDEHKFSGRDYDETFCEQALRLISDQRRLYHQLRAVARTVGQSAGSSSVKTDLLVNMLGTEDSARMIQQLKGQSLFSSRRDGMPSLMPLQSSANVLQPRPERTCCPCLRKRAQKKVDGVREEWENDQLEEMYENQQLDLLAPLGVPLPVDNTCSLAKIEPDRCFVAHSAVAPVVMCYRLASGQDEEEGSSSASTPVQRRLFALKTGDDLRQDALILQMFRIMDAQWEQAGLREVLLKPYEVLAVSPTEGIVAFVPRANKVSSILQEHEGDVHRYIEQQCSSPEEGFDRLCGSTAGYCVATYLLGVGDRHLDNIMITEDGHFFHIDFGFVLGDDPKPGAPSVRAPREVLEAIRSSGRYDHFRELVGKAFLLLRRTARLWTGLLALASAAGGNGVSVLKDHPQRAMHTVRERLHLTLSEEAAKAEILAEVEDGAMAMLPVVYDKLHQFGLFWK